MTHEAMMTAYAQMIYEALLEGSSFEDSKELHESAVEYAFQRIGLAPTTKDWMESEIPMTQDELEEHNRLVIGYKRAVLERAVQLLTM